jgi:outer membrane protein OmpA-like peptidoglycan-associated protein
MVIGKKSAQPLPEVPTLPPLPDLSKAKDKQEALPPAIAKNMETIFAKQPEKTGVISDKTQIIDPTIKAKQAAEAAAQKAAQEKEAAARDKEKEAARQVALAAKEMKETAPTSPLAALPAPTMPPVRAPVIAPAPPAPELPEKIALSATSEADLPPLPALPSLTPITGEGERKTSLEVAQPTDGVESRDLTVASAGAAMQPLDAPEAFPKVTSGKPTHETSDVPPTLPPPPSAAPARQAAAAPAPPLPAVPPVALAPAAKEAAKEAATPAADAAKTEKDTTPKAPSAGESVQAVILFDRDKTDVSEKGKSQLTNLAPQIIKNNQQVRIVAYAAGTPEQASVARRISLSRALQIRAFLIGKGVNQMNVNVQALGNKRTDGPAERADIFVK